MSHSKLKLAFAGTPEIARTVLEALIQDGTHSVELILTQPDRPAGRGKKNKPSEVKLCALEHGIKIIQPESANELLPNCLNNCDLMLVVAYGLLIKPDVLATPKYGCINIHTSLLPRWRGAAPIQRAIEAGDKETGITFMQMDSGLDTGPMLKQIHCPILPDDNAGELHDRLADLSAKHINDLLVSIARSEMHGIVQDDSKATYAKKISKQEARLDWGMPAVDLVRKIKAFNPFPIAHTQINNVDIRIWEATVKPNQTPELIAGTILESKTSLDIVTGNGTLTITRLQLPGKRAVSARDFLNGHPEFTSSNLVAN